jgi:hypothetical protein
MSITKKFVGFNRVQMVCSKSINIESVKTNILWHVDPLLGNNRETNYTTVVTRQKPIYSNRGIVFLCGP